MPIKWNITGKAMGARGVMDQISREYDGFTQEGSEHLADLKSLRGQLDELKMDLHGAANVMGNSSSGSGEVAEPPKTETPPQTAEQPKAEPVATPSPPEVGPSNTFRSG